MTRHLQLDAQQNLSPRLLILLFIITPLQWMELLYLKQHRGLNACCFFHVICEQSSMCLRII